MDIHLFESSAPSWPRHWHEELQIVTSLSGWSRHEVSGSSQIVAPGGVFVVDPGIAHTTVAVNDSSWRFVALHLPIEKLARFRDENGPSGFGTFSFGQAVFRHAEVHRLLISLHKSTVEASSPLFQNHCMQELMSSLWSLSREPLRPFSKKLGSRLGLDHARDYLHEHFAAKITLGELAKVAAISEFHFCRLFSRRFGLPPHAYQLQLRLAAAKRLLRTGTAVRVVACAVGFSSHSHLTRAFLRVNGLTPSEFQKDSKIVQEAVLSRGHSHLRGG